MTDPGGGKISNQPSSSVRVAGETVSETCGAKTRAGVPCLGPAMPNGRCRVHGGLSPGAPRGAANGNYRDGYWTREAVAERKFIRSLLETGTTSEAMP